MSARILTFRVLVTKVWCQSVTECLGVRIADDCRLSLCPSVPHLQNVNRVPAVCMLYRPSSAGICASWLA